jgi:DNA repair protein REV1
LEIYISESEDITKIASELRQNIAEDTQCTASIGISENKLMAKLATNRIKPNGLLLVTDSPSFLQGVSLSDLPGIGSQIGPKLMLSDLKTVQNVLDLGDNDIERERFLQDIVGPARAKKLVSQLN